MSSQLQSQQQIISRLQYEVSMKDTQRKDIHTELVREKQNLHRMQEEYERKFRLEH